MKQVIIFIFICLCFCFSCSTTNHGITRSNLLQKIEQIPDNNFSFYQTLYQLGKLDELYRIINKKKKLNGLSHKETLLLAQTCIYKGDYEYAKTLLNNIRNEKDFKKDAQVLLSVIYYHNNQYSHAIKLLNNVEEKDQPDILRIMKMFNGSKPYRIDWMGKNKESIDFISGPQQHTLPYIKIAVNGKEMTAYIDTGGDQLVIPHSIAKELNIKEHFQSMGIFAGGKTATEGFSRVKSLQLGKVLLYNVPITISYHEKMACLGTGVLRQFISTIDYTNNKLVISPRTKMISKIIDIEKAEQYTFGYMGSHLLFGKVCINDYKDFHFLIDSGLDSPQAGALPKETLDFLDIRHPFRFPAIGKGGSGTELFFVGQAKVKTIGIGNIKHHDQAMLVGIYPNKLYFDDDIQVGFIVDGLISQEFLRYYAWTIDFENRKMYFH